MPLPPPSRNRLPDAPSEAQAFASMRWRLARNHLRFVLREARLKLVTVLLLTGLFWLGTYWLFAEGLTLLDLAIQHEGTYDQVIAKVFEVFFFSLLVMLAFSSGVFLYGSLYRAHETRFLLSLPARDGRVFIHKFQESMLFCSWGSLLLGTPLLVAYGRGVEASWGYYLMLLPALAGFVYIPGSLGAVVCLFVVRFLPRNRRRWLLLLGALAGAVGGLFLWRTLAGGAQLDLLTPGWFQDVIGRLGFSESRLLPSWWLSTALRRAAHGEWGETFPFLALLAANALLLHQIAVGLAGRWYRAGYSRLSDYPLPRHSARMQLLDHGVSWLSAGFSPHMRTVLLKDFRLFRRDPVQWTQFLVFFGMLALYSVNVRRLSYNTTSTAWVNMISFLNLAVVGLILSAFTTRFIFPLVSLEGRRFWILALLPLSRDTLLWSKFVFAATGSLVTCLTLVGLSDLSLSVQPLIVGMHVLACVVLCVGLSGIAVGLGAWIPNLREESSARISAGFGGTLNLVVSTLYILVVITLVAVPCHFHAAAADIGWTIQPLVKREHVEAWLIGGAVLSLIVGALAVGLPMYVGLKRFRELEIR